LGDLVVIDHPLVAHKLSLMRSKATPSVQFRTLLREISLLLGYEVLRDLPTELRDIETPVGPHAGALPQGQEAGVSCRSCVPATGSSTACSTFVPSARVGHIGVYRDPATLAAVEYYCKLPEDIAERLTVVVDPMLATGNSAVAALPGSRRVAPATSASSACWPRPRHRRGGPRASRRARLHRRPGRAPERPRLHRPRPRRRRRPAVRDEIAATPS